MGRIRYNSIKSVLYLNTSAIHKYNMFVKELKQCDDLVQQLQTAVTANTKQSTLTIFSESKEIIRLVLNEAAYYYIT